MIHRPELLTALEAAPTGPLAQKAWRHMFGNHRPDQENMGGARWNPSGVPAIYLSTTRAGAIAEGDHAIAVQPFRPKARRYVYEVELTLDAAVDLTADEDLTAAGLAEKDIGDDDFTACQEVGAAVHWLERDGLLVPSARGTSPNLVVYPTHRATNAVFDFGDGQAID